MVNREGGGAGIEDDDHELEEVRSPLRIMTRHRGFGHGKWHDDDDDDGSGNTIPHPYNMTTASGDTTTWRRIVSNHGIYLL